MSPTGSLDALFSLVAPELEAVEGELAATARHDSPALAPSLARVLPGNGKRLRPALALLSGKQGRFDLEPMIDMAVGVELLHTASLIHDDVVDGSETRRGSPTLFTQVGSPVAVLLGDYLFSQAAARCVATGNLRVIQLFAETLGSMCRGQIEEVSRPRDVYKTLSQEDYFQTIWAKTASLFVLACQGAAILAGLAEPAIQGIRTYGAKLGLAFQVVDDILDIVGDERLLGKPTGSDLKRGTITLPMIFLRDELVDGQFTRLFEGAPLEELLAAVRQSAALGRTYGEARALVEGARDALSALPTGQARDALEALPRQVIERMA